MKITVLGAGYVGLVSAACFAEFGVEVTCVEINPQRLEALRNLCMPFFEPGLADLVNQNVRAQRLSFSAQPAPAIRGSDVVFIAVGTPGRADGSGLDITQVHDAAHTIAQHMSPDHHPIIVTRSTVPVGTAQTIEELIRQKRPELAPGRDFDVAANPEFLREGSAIEDFMHPDRIVLGTASEFAANALASLYRPLSLREIPIMQTDRITAELVKYTTNAYLATKITFINEIADLCEHNGANIADIAKALGMDRRIGPMFLHPGPGFGGSCLPKDTVALVDEARQHGLQLQTVSAVIAANRARRALVVDRVVAALDGETKERRIAVLGLAFKPGTDDLREAVSTELVPALLNLGMEVSAHDPEAIPKAKLLPEFAGIEFSVSAWDAIQGADALVVLTEWSEYRGLSPTRIREALATPVVIDMRNIFDDEAMLEAGIRYFCIGRPWPRIG